MSASQKYDQAKEKFDRAHESFRRAEQDAFVARNHVNAERDLELTEKLLKERLNNLDNAIDKLDGALQVWMQSSQQQASGGAGNQSIVSSADSGFVAYEKAKQEFDEAHKAAAEAQRSLVMMKKHLETWQLKLDEAHNTVESARQSLISAKKELDEAFQTGPLVQASANALVPHDGSSRGVARIPLVGKGRKPKQSIPFPSAFGPDDAELEAQEDARHVARRIPVARSPNLPCKQKRDRTQPVSLLGSLAQATALQGEMGPSGWNHRHHFGSQQRMQAPRLKSHYRERVFPRPLAAAAAKKQQQQSPGSRVQRVEEAKQKQQSRLSRAVETGKNFAKSGYEALSITLAPDTKKQPPKPIQSGEVVDLYDDEEATLTGKDEILPPARKGTPKSQGQADDWISKSSSDDEFEKKPKSKEDAKSSSTWDWNEPQDDSKAVSKNDEMGAAATTLVSLWSSHESEREDDGVDVSYNHQKKRTPSFTEKEDIQIDSDDEAIDSKRKGGEGAHGIASKRYKSSWV